MTANLVRWRCWHAAFLLLTAAAGCGDHGGAAAPDEEHAASSEARVTVRTEPVRLGAMSEVVEGLGRCEALPDHIATLTPAVEGHAHALIVAQAAMPSRRGSRSSSWIKQSRKLTWRRRRGPAMGSRPRWPCSSRSPAPRSGGPTCWRLRRPKSRSSVPTPLVESLEALQRDSNLVPKLQLLDARKALEGAQFQQQAAEATLNAMMIGPRPEAVAEAEGKIKTADGLVAFSQAHLDYHTIRAPIDGVLDSLTCHPGQTIAIGSPIGEVVDTRQVFASVWLPIRSVSSVRVGLAARVRPRGRPSAFAECLGRGGRGDGRQGRVPGASGRPADRQSADSRAGG